MSTSLSLLVPAVVCVALMGYAIQRGGTCTVAAVEEIVRERRATRLVAMGEAALWVAGGLVLARWLGLPGAMPPAYAPGGWTLLGGALLGLGGWVNRACVIGAIARLGSGEWAYLATPLGFYAGCLSVPALFGTPMARPLPGASALPEAAAWLAPAAVLAAAWRAPGLVRSGTASPHVATAMIGITFLLSLLLAGRWTYTDVLADLAEHGMAAGLATRALLLAALYAGALWGGWTAGRWRPAMPTAAALARCFAGGVLMGWGSLLIPGANDGLILVGMPLLRPYAWLAFLTMGVVIAAALGIARARRAPAPAAGGGR